MLSVIDSATVLLTVIFQKPLLRNNVTRQKLLAPLWDIRQTNDIYENVSGK